MCALMLYGLAVGYPYAAIVRRRGMFVKWGIVLLGVGVLSACVTVPNGPNVMVLPRAWEAF